MQPIGLYSIEQWWVAHQRRKTCSSSTFQMRTNGKPLSKECEMQASIPSQRQSPTGIVKPWHSRTRTAIASFSNKQPGHG